ncbi:MAG: aminoacylase [Bacteroidetes bacterium]|nr:MAG: aminoacylase [Bacteroidota bacterium]
MKKLLFVAAAILLLASCKQPQHYDTIIRNGMIYDGNGGEPYAADIAINADTIAFIGKIENAKANSEIDAHGMAIAPGFINMLSWANISLIQNGNSQSDIRQGVTLEVMGEGESMGPLNAVMKAQEQNGQGDIKYKVEWNSFGDYFNYMEKKGISCNLASFVGATTVREYVVGEDNRAPSPQELEHMKQLVDTAMQEGALGVGSSLIYPPAFFAKTDELVALCEVASKYGGSYISHMRSEGNQIFEAVRELIEIAKRAKVHAEIYHLKAAGKNNWNKMDSVIKMVEAARAQGLDITADMYTYPASATGLTACFPPSLQDGGFGKLWQRLQDPKIRKEMAKAMNTNTQDWENTYYQVGSPDKILLLSFKQDSLKKFTGKTLAEVAKIKGKSPEETAMDLIVEDSTRIGVSYFSMTEDNLKKEVVQPWVSFGSDEGSYSLEDSVFLKSNAHPRAYGTFVRVLGKYSRDEKLIPLQKAIYKLSKLPATNLKLQKRGELKVGNYADVVIFDPATVTDHATFVKPHQYATGVNYVFVNGTMVLNNGTHTGAKPGRFIKGPGYKKS